MIKKEYRNVIRTKKRIRQAFADLLGEKRDSKPITVAELAEKADVAKSTFYNHYDDVYAVAEEFQNELIDKITDVLNEIEVEKATEYDAYIKSIFSFLKDNEDLYRKAIRYSEVKFFIEKLKAILSKKIFDESATLPFAKDKKERYVQVRFLTNACVDTLVDYFEDRMNVSLEELSEIILNILGKLK